MLHALLQVVWTEKCVGSVCTQPPYNDKKSTQCFNSVSVWRVTLVSASPFTPPATYSDRATWSHSFLMESRRLPATRVTVGDGMWACQAMRVKRQKLRIAQLYANEQRISRATTNRSEGSVSGAHTSPSRVHARQDRFLERSHCFKWFDCNNIKMMHGK